MEHVNYWAVLVSTLASFCLGGLWYSPIGFLKTWMSANGIKKEDKKGSHGMKNHIICIVMSLIAAFAFGLLVRHGTSLHHSVKLGVLIGVGFVFTSLAVNYLYSNKKWKLLLIDGGYYIVQFILFGFIFGLWPR